MKSTHRTFPVTLLSSFLHLWMVKEKYVWWFHRRASLTSKWGFLFYYLLSIAYFLNFPCFCSFNSSHFLYLSKDRTGYSLIHGQELSSVAKYRSYLWMIIANKYKFKVNLRYLHYFFTPLYFILLARQRTYEPTSILA